jgi:amino acid permease
MKQERYKFRTSTVIKAVIIGLTVNIILLFPFYYFSVLSSSKSFFITIPLGIGIYLSIYRYFIHQAKKKGMDMTKPI